MRQVLIRYGMLPTSQLLLEGANTEEQRRDNQRKLVAGEEKESLLFNQDKIPAGQIVIHGASGPYLMDRDKWPNLQLPQNIDSQKSNEEMLEGTEMVIDQSQDDSNLNLNSEAEDKRKPKDGTVVSLLDSGNEEEVLTQELELMESASFQSLGDKSDDEHQQPWIKSQRKRILGKEGGSDDCHKNQ